MCQINVVIKKFDYIKILLFNTPQPTNHAFTSIQINKLFPYSEKGESGDDTNEEDEKNK